MPIYVYRCDSCNRHSEIFQHFTDDSLTVCPDCGEATLQRVYQVAYVHFKGDGWYVADKGKAAS